MFASGSSTTAPRAATREDCQKRGAAMAMNPNDLKLANGQRVPKLTSFAKECKADDPRTRRGLRNVHHEALAAALAGLGMKPVKA